MSNNIVKKIKIGEAEYNIGALTDANSNNIVETYETKTNSSNKLKESKDYTDTKIANLLNNSTEAVDSIFELRDAMEENADAITALETIAAGHADKIHTHKVEDITDITVDATEINYLDGVTSNVQTQLDGKSNSGHTHDDKMNKNNPTGTGSFSLNRKSNTTVGTKSVAEGSDTTASGFAAHAEGANTVASGGYSHAEGSDTTASGSYSHAEGFHTIASGGFGSHAEGYMSKALGEYSHTEGYMSHTLGKGAHAEGYSLNPTFSETFTEETTDEEIIELWDESSTTAFNLAKGWGSHTEGVDTLAIGQGAHAEGQWTMAFGGCAHSEGARTRAKGDYSHAEGGRTIASGNASHAEGHETIASGEASHAEGINTEAKGHYSHAEGLFTIALGANQHVQGKFNIGDTENKYAHIVGNGSFETPSNAHTLDWDGNAWFAGNITVGANKKQVSTTDHTHSYLPLAGGTITGSLNAKFSNIDASLANNGVSSTQYPTTFSILDKSNRILTRKEAIIGADGSIAAYWYVRNYDTSGKQVAQKGIKISMNKSGAISYSVDEGSKFLSAIGGAASGHTHDDRYYTESEINSKLNTINSNLTTALNGVSNNASSIAALNSKIKFYTWEKQITVPGTGAYTFDIGNVITYSGYTFLGYMAKDSGYGDQWLISYGTYGGKVQAMVYSKYGASLTQTVRCTGLWIKN